MTSPKVKTYEVLIIDNEQSISSFYKNVLLKYSVNEKINFEIEEADDGLTGLSQIFKKVINCVEAYDLIICDDLMTFLDGIEMYRILVYLVENNICKLNIFESTLSKIVFCSSDTENVKNKLGKNLRTCEKPLTIEQVKKLVNGSP